MDFLKGAGYSAEADYILDKRGFKIASVGSGGAHRILRVSKRRRAELGGSGVGCRLLFRLRG